MNHSTTPKDLIPLAAASRLLGVSRYTVRRRLLEGRICGWRVGGGDWRVSRAEVMQYVSQGAGFARRYQLNPAGKSGDLIPLSLAAAQLGVTTATLINWIRDKKLKGVRSKSRWHVRMADVQRLAKPAGESIVHSEGQEERSFKSSRSDVANTASASKNRPFS